MRPFCHFLLVLLPVTSYSEGKGGAVHVILLIITGLSLFSGCALDEDALDEDFTPLSLHRLQTGEWSVPASRLLLAQFEGRVYGLDIVTGKVSVTTFAGKNPSTTELFTLPAGCSAGEIFSPAAFQPLTADSFLIADRYGNRLHLVTDQGAVRKTLMLSRRGFFPRGTHIAARSGEMTGAVLFCSFSARGEILLVRTNPFRVVSSAGRKHPPLSSEKGRLRFHPFFGDLVHTAEGFFRFTYIPSLYRERGRGAEDLKTLFSELRKYGFSFVLSPHQHPYKKSLLKPLLTRAELIPVPGKGRKEALLLCYDDLHKRIFAMTPRGRMKRVIPWPEALSWDYPHLIMTAPDRFLFYGQDDRFELYETGKALFK